MTEEAISRPPLARPAINQPPRLRPATSQQASRPMISPPDRDLRRFGRRHGVATELRDYLERNLAGELAPVYDSIEAIDVKDGVITISTNLAADQQGQ